jgi:hypothetical protein
MLPAFGMEVILMNPVVEQNHRPVRNLQMSRTIPTESLIW